MPDTAPSIVTAIDTPDCPMCGALAVKLGRQDRACFTCGLTWTVITARDELDAAADREVRSRDFNEVRGKSRAIPKGANRW